MGSYANIKIGKYDFWWEKNGIRSLLYIFNPDDYIKTIEKDDNGEEYIYHKLITNVKKAKEILDSTGYSMTSAENFFNKIIKQINFDDNEEVIYYFNLYFSDDNEETIEKIKSEYNFQNWKKTIEFATKNLILYGVEHSDENFEVKIKNLESSNIFHNLILKSLALDNDFFYWGIPIELLSWHADELIMRVILECIDENEPIELDYTDLVDGGYCEEILPQSYFEIEKTIVLTEGRTDRDYIQDSINLLYPHLSKCFYFMNFTQYNVEGSADFLPRYIKAFAGAGIKNKIIGLFDNDTAGKCAKKTLDRYLFPSNIKLASLPDIELAKNFEVIDNNGNVSNQNINGIACSIELFFGKDVLLNGNTFEKVELKDFRKEVNAFQGTIQNKSSIQKRFDKKLKYAKQNGISNLEDWKEMKILIESLINIWN